MSDIIPCSGLRRAQVSSVFGHPRSTILGLLSALYSLGSICSLPFVPYVTDKWGRKFAIAFGSVIMIIGAALQTSSQDCAYERFFVFSIALADLRL